MSWARNSVGERGDNIGLPDVTTADNGKIMEVESGEWKLKEGSGGGGGIPAPENPSDGDVLTYDSTTSAWVAEAPSGGGGGVLVITVNNSTHALNKTFSEIYTAYIAGTKCIVEQEESQEEYTITHYYDVMEIVRTDINGNFGQGMVICTSVDGMGGLSADIYRATSLDGYPTIIM